MNCRDPHLKASVLLLFIAFLSIGIFQLSLQNDPPWREIPREDQSDFILSEDNPAFSQEYSATRITNIEIASITTNDTPVLLTIANETSIKLSLDNVTRLRGLSININPQPPEVITVIVSWTNKTASVRLEIVIMDLIPPPYAMSRTLPILPIAGICGAFLLGYRLFRFRQQCWNPVLTHKDSHSTLDQIVPLTLLVLALVSGAMVSPLLDGIVGNDYALQETEVLLDQLSVQDALNVSNAMLSYNFTDIANSYNTSIERIAIHSLDFGDESLKAEWVIGEESMSFLVNGSYISTDWSLEPDFQEDPCMLYLHRIGEDVQVSFIIDITTIDEVPKNSPTVPVGLAICGVLVFVLGLYRSWQIERILNETVTPETE